MAVSPDAYLMPHSAVDEVEDGCHRDDQVDHLMLQVVLLQMNLMEMSTFHLEVPEGLDVLDVEEEGMRWSTVMLSIPVMRLLVMMDRWSLLLPGGDDGLQAACALLPCENRWAILNFLSQDVSDGEVSLLLSCHPGLHDNCRCLSSSLSLVDDSDDYSLMLTLFSLASLSHDGDAIMMSIRIQTGDGCFHSFGENSSSKSSPNPTKKLGNKG